MVRHGRTGRQDSSFSEEKEAKRLCLIAVAPAGQRAAKLTKVSWFFFPKKNASPAWPDVAAALAGILERALIVA
ncbi:hypothetical protein IBL26_11930 [Roseomonas aerophila]|uniref:Uncharacterized protein n=1 Tax=Teichococcus aerophilus TaxID=1224513 RepID=A0ABR7RLT1_9PROT|nr:hypothetical protein [Pseudoroseomonas aerophila]MBC9207544.1 hypothetical protein [Pseudoroseomonas aerophila]